MGRSLTPISPGAFRTQRMGGAARDTGQPTLDELPTSDWVRMWAGFPARHLPASLARELQVSVSETCVRVMLPMALLAATATLIVVSSLVPLDRTSGQIWTASQVALFIAIFVVVANLNRRATSNTLTTAMVNRWMFLPVAAAGISWGTLPGAVGDEPLSYFYMSVTVTTMFCLIGFLWLFGHWPLSMMFAILTLGFGIVMFQVSGEPGLGLIAMLTPVLLAGLLATSALTSIGLIRALYNHAVAREREQLVGLLLEDYDRGGHDWLWETDADLRLVHAPSRMLNAAHGDPRFRPGTPLQEILCDNPVAREALRRNEPFEANVRVEGDEGSGAIRLWGRPKNAAGRRLGYRGLGSDEDANQRAEEAERTRERLEAMVNLTSGLAHDFNNLLASVLGAVELAALETDLPDTANDHLSRAIDACLRTRRLTTDLVVASGQDATYQPTAVTVRTAVHEVVHDVRPLYPDVTIEIDERYPVIAQVDRSHLMRAVRNLIENACQALTEPSTAEPPAVLRVPRVVVTIDAYIGEDGTMAALRVSDNGPGIAPQDSARVFEPFFSTRKARGGSGLGLSVVRGFAHQAGGSLTMTPSNVGAAFLLQVPLSGQTNNAPVEIQPWTTDGTMALDGHFIVVEDDPQVLENISLWIRSLGGTVDSASTVAEALHRFDGRTTDCTCLISDIALPDGEGYEVVAALRRSDPNLRAIYMSGFTHKLPTSVEPDARCPFVAKPFSSRELLATLRVAGVGNQPSPAT